MSLNERKTENLVRDSLRKLGYYDNDVLVVEEQKSDYSLIDNLLKRASKKGKGKGYPEFIIRSTEKNSLIIVIECKADIKKHESEKRNQFAEYAVDGVLWHAAHLSKEFDVLAIGLSGQNRTELKVSHIDKWKTFTYDELFDLKKGKRLTKSDMERGNVPFIGAIDKNNGCRQFIQREPIHLANTITVNYNGSVGEAFYQNIPFWASDDVNVLYPKFELNVYTAHFLTTIIRQEKYRFSYGRKWHAERMEKSIIKLPVNSFGKPDWEFMENYMKNLSFNK